MSVARVTSLPAIDAAEPNPTTLVYDAQQIGVTFKSSAGPLDVLEDITFKVRPGEIVGIVGPSGTGKTTLLRLLGGFQQPTRGQLLYGGQPISGPPQGVVTVFQDYANALLPWRTLLKNVALPLEGSVARKDRLTRAQRALEMVGLGHRSSDYPWRLSGGMQQRVQLARAFVLDPEVLLMDEPFGALDAFTRAALQDEFLQLQRSLGTTVIFITHDLDEALYLSDRVLLIAGSPGSITYDRALDLPGKRNQIETRENKTFLSARHDLGQALERAMA